MLWEASSILANKMGCFVYKKHIFIYFCPSLIFSSTYIEFDYWFQLQILPLFTKHKVVHFNKTDARLANNGLPIDLQKLRCRVNYQALKFTPQIENLGQKLVQILHERGPFVALHLRYEMDMLAFSGCTLGCTNEEAEDLKRMRYIMFPVLLCINLCIYMFLWEIGPSCIVCVA
jgi:hypothetical protein